MATHNGERFIRQQLESILPQLGAHDELVISDDGSTDGTLDIIRSLPDPRVRLYTEKTFNSPILNFDYALGKAKKGVIVLSDQDDVWMENKLDTVRRVFGQAPEGIFTLVMDGDMIDEKGAVICDSIMGRLKAGPGLLKNLYDNTYVGCCMAFSRTLLDVALPFPPTIPMHDVWLGLLGELFGSVAFLREKTIHHRRHGANISPINRRIDVVRQVRRRWFLATHLAKRFLEHRRR